ncbi:cation:proton antiporter [Flammeovirga agarivorans]|uniref:Sodium:proton antiporter n=1 Tax=Flammeovirga agarivorans TaxID=2726742 RepID=A0A7X8XVG7_9BACT|nr:sodium:proton antiporter [Flammeovirga agarivorans]NLR91323.1 sodium:proton antiporter [Flammeovirga agarivorans]
MVELASLIGLGFFAQWLGWKVKIPAILPLILIGLLVGPVSTLFTPDGAKFIDGDKIFHGDLMFDVVNLSVGLILFEGGMTLKIKETKNLGGVIWRILIFGTIITLIGGALATHYIMGFSYRIAFLFGGLIIVSGPTVVGPMLRNIKPNNRINTILKWEGILIDPIGALTAILIFDFVLSGQPNELFTFFALKGFILLTLAGLFVGGVASFITIKMLNDRNILPEHLKNTIILGAVIGTFALSDMLHAESGLLAVTVYGMIIGNSKVASLKSILHFTEDITVILISFLFVMLSSRMQVDDLLALVNTKSALLFIVIIYVIRPLVVLSSTIGTSLSWRERIFISYISPRGIVAAGVASLFTIKLTTGSVPINEMQVEEAKMLLPLTFMIIVGTVVIQGLTAKPLAKALKVTRKEPNGILFLGASEVGRFIAKILKKYDIPVMMSDTSKPNIREAQGQGIKTYEGSILSEGALEFVDFSAYGQLFSTTSNDEINILGNRTISSELGMNKVFRLASRNEVRMNTLQKPQHLLFQGKYDFIGLTHLIRRKHIVKNVKSEQYYDQEESLKLLSTFDLPIFILHANHYITPVTDSLSEINEGDEIIYLEFTNS